MTLCILLFGLQYVTVICFIAQTVQLWPVVASPGWFLDPLTSLTCLHRVLRTSLPSGAARRSRLIWCFSCPALEATTTSPVSPGSFFSVFNKWYLGNMTQPGCWATFFLELHVAFLPLPTLSPSPFSSMDSIRQLMLLHSAVVPGYFSSFISNPPL